VPRGKVPHFYVTGHYMSFGGNAHKREERRQYERKKKKKKIRKGM